MRIPEVEPRRFHVLSADIEAYDHRRGCPGCAPLASHGRPTKPHNNECRERIRTTFEGVLTRKARMNAYKDTVAETERVKERTKVLWQKEVQVRCQEWRATDGSRCGPIWRGRETTRREHNERHPHWNRGQETALKNNLRS